MLFAAFAAAAAHDRSATFGAWSMAALALMWIPIVYASLNFGLTGSIATAAWVTLLCVPVLMASGSHAERIVELIVLAGVDSVAVVVGQRVEHETAMRHEAELARERHRRAEARYKALFSTSASPILILDADTVIREANAAAMAAFGDKLVGCRAGDALRITGDAWLGRTQPSVVNLVDPGGSSRSWAVSSSPVVSDSGEVTQMLLHDVTAEETERQRMASYAAQVLRGQEDERRRLAQEIHDEPVQSLIHLARRIDALATIPTIDTVTATKLTEVREFAVDIGRQLRQLARGLRPPILDDLGLTSALRRLLADFRTESGVATSLKVIGEPARLPGEVELGLYRIAQEALQNVRRHARGSSVRLLLRFSPESVSLSVADDGVGFAASPQRHPGLGIVGMRERAALMGGSLMVDARLGRGVRVRATVPTALVGATKEPTGVGPTVG